MRGVLLFACVAVGGLACSDVNRFSTKPGESYCGSIVQGPFVRSGFGPAVQMRLSFNADQIAATPGAVSTSDGLLQSASLRAIPQVLHDPLATLQFGEGRQRNLLYFVSPYDAANRAPFLSVMSLLESGDIEVRLMRGAWDGAAGAPSSSTMKEPAFGVFPLHRQQGTCGF